MFIISTIMMASSLQMQVGSGASSFLGQNSMNQVAARGVAKYGLVGAQNDILSDLNSGQTVDTSYSYTQNVSMPTNPNNQAALDYTVGSYTATITKAYGNAYMVKVVGTVGTSQSVIYKLMMLQANGFILDRISGATAAYSLRRLRAGYTGAAIRVRRSRISASMPTVIWIPPPSTRL
jgi:hypothetical protein